MKTLSLLLLSILLSACDPSYSNETTEYKLPPELEGCKVFTLKDSDLNKITVLYCKDKTTTNHSYNEGKITRYTATVYD